MPHAAALKVVGGADAGTREDGGEEEEEDGWGADEGGGGGAGGGGEVNDGAGLMVSCPVYWSASLIQSGHVVWSQCS